MPPLEIIVIFVAGAVGALVNDVVNDNKLELPKNIDGQFCLGFIGGLLIGGIAGLAIDGSISTAFMGGFMGKELVLSFVNKQREIFLKTTQKEKQTAITNQGPTTGTDANEQIV
jgi:hypothetical protein